MKETDFESYTNSYVCKGCRQCVKGEKLVLFMGGACSRECSYCSLSENRKKCSTVFANERPVNVVKDLIMEAEESNSRGAGITGGDPLVYFEKTKEYSAALKKRFGPHFHIHIYLPLNLVTESKLKELKETIDEVRFHPSFLENDSKELREKEIAKIKKASGIFGKRNCGVELPCLPESKEKIYDFLVEVSDFIGFCNLNEFEISETNFEKITQEYVLNEDTYTVNGSIEAGQWIIVMVEENKIDLPVHLCTARTKDCYQFVNRLIKHNILPYGKKTDEGTVVYFATYYGGDKFLENEKKDSGKNKLKDEGGVLGSSMDDEAEKKNLEESEKKIRGVTKNYHVDKENKRILINMKDVEKVYKKTKLKIARVEEHPTYGSEYLEFGYIDE